MNESIETTINELRAQLTEEHAEAFRMISEGKLIPVNDILKKSLDRVTGEIQLALEAGDDFNQEDLVSICGIETVDIFEGFDDDTPQGRSDHARTLFELSLGLLTAKTAH